MTFKPMLASPAETDKLKFPLLASPKLDGVRAIVRDGVVLSRSLKPIPNLHVQSLFSEFEYFDGELIVGPPTSKTCYTDTVSGVMRVTGEPDVRFYVFDHVCDYAEPYLRRVREITGMLQKHWQFVAHTPVDNLDQLDAYEQVCLAQGYEGVMLRDPQGKYKFGRSTAKEGLLLKVKRFTDSEFEVVGYEERMHNGNEATINELGRTKRSSHAAGKSGLGDLGALVLQGDGFTFNCGTGFDDATRKDLWAIRDRGLIGRIAKIKHFEVGAKVAPRHPVFLGFRDPLDL